MRRMVGLLLGIHLCVQGAGAAPGRRVVRRSAVSGGPISVEQQLYKEIYSMHFDRVQKILCDAPELINAPIDPRGNKPLHLASNWLNLEMTEYLLMRGADVNERNNEGRTPLMMPLASYRADRAYEISALLLQHQADVTLKDAQGKTALDLVNALRISVLTDVKGLQKVKDLLQHHEAAAKEKAQKEQEEKQ